MGTTNHLLREILQEIREVKAHVIPQRQSVISPSVVARSPVLDPAYRVAESATKGEHKGKPRWYKANTEEYTYEFPALSPPNRPFAVASAGGGGEDENENCPAESFTGPPQLPNATRNARLMGRMSKEDVAGLSREDKKRRCELKKMVSEERKASRSSEEQAKIDARVAAMQAARGATRASAGGGSVLSLQEFISLMSKPSNEEREHISSLLGPVKSPKKIIANNLVFNPVLDCFVDREGKCFYADLNETTLEPIPNMSKMIGKIRPGVAGEQAQASNFVPAKERSRKRKNSRNRTRKN